MDPYILHGLVLPERTLYNFGPLEETFEASNGTKGRFLLNVVSSYVTVWWFVDEPWDLHDLRNSVAQVALDRLSILAYATGVGLDVEIRQVLHYSLGIDWVYGPGVPCLMERNAKVDALALAKEVGPKANGPVGIYIFGCLNNLRMAMKEPRDTPFYLHRAFESLRQYCIHRYAINAKAKDVQWAKISELTGFSERDLGEIRTLSEAARHGELTPITSDTRARLFLLAWDVVDAFLAKI